VKLLGFKTKKMYRTKTKEELLEEFGEEYWKKNMAKDMFFEEFGKEVYEDHGYGYLGYVKGSLVKLNSFLITDKPILSTTDVPIKVKVHIEIDFECFNTYNYTKAKARKLIGQYSISEIKNNKVLEWKDDEYNMECMIVDKVIVNKIEIK
jgi:hypothetical protein